MFFCPRNLQFVPILWSKLTQRLYDHHHFAIMALKPWFFPVKHGKMTKMTNRTMEFSSQKIGPPHFLIGFQPSHRNQPSAPMAPWFPHGFVSLGTSSRGSSSERRLEVPQVKTAEGSLAALVGGFTPISLGVAKMENLGLTFFPLFFWFVVEFLCLIVWLFNGC